MSTAQEKELALKPKADVPAVYRVASLPTERMGALLKENLGGAGLKFTDLQMFGGQSGGKTEWSVETGAGPKAIKELRGIVIHHTTDPRRYYEKTYDPRSVTPPDCTSNDGVTGYGTPGGGCAVCPMNQWGSANGGTRRGKACKEQHLLFLLREKDLIPCLIAPPPTSLRSIQNFFLDMVSDHGCFFYEVEARFWLAPSSKGDGVLIHGEVVRMLGAEEVAKVEAYRQAILPSLTEAARATTEPF